MPLIQGASDAAKSANIRQMIKTDGRPQDQAVAIAMDIAKRSRRAEGGRSDLKTWFGKSRVVDKSGEPLTVYHGTDQSRSIHKFRTPAYFSNDPSFANRFGSRSTYPVHLKIENPYVIDAKTAGRHFDWDAEDVRDMRRKGHDGIHVDNGGDGDIYTVFDPSQVRSKITGRAEGGGLPGLKLNLPMPSAAKRPKLHTGPIHSHVAGRTDHLPMNVPNKAYVLPADIVGGMGQGNTIAGFRIAKKLPDIFHRMLYGSSASSAPYGQEAGAPYGHGMPHAAGGEVGEDEEGVPIIAAGGEHVYHPREVAKFGDGDVDLGHDILDAFVKQYRAEQIKTLKNLPGPKRD